MELVDVTTKGSATTYVDERGFERSKRDGRPKIYSEDGSKGKLYSRTTKYISVIDDETKLVDWKLRRVLEGASLKPEFIEEFKLIEDHNTLAGKKAGDKIVSAAMKAAGYDWKADLGTVLHELTEEIDGGLDPFIPPEFADSLAAFAKVTKGLKVLGVENFVVCDELAVGGTFDRLYQIVDKDLAEDLGKPPGTVVIGDVKTKGEVWYSSGEIARQMAIYAHGQVYDPLTHKRSPIVEPPLVVDQDLGLIIWMPSTPKEGDPLCAIVPSDIKSGWKSVQVAKAVREERNFWNRKAQKPDPVRAVGASDL